MGIEQNVVCRKGEGRIERKDTIRREKGDLEEEEEEEEEGEGEEEGVTEEPDEGELCSAPAGSDQREGRGGGERITP